MKHGIEKGKTEIRLSKDHLGVKLREFTNYEGTIIYGDIGDLQEHFDSVEDVETIVMELNKALNKPIIDITDDEGHV